MGFFDDDVYENLDWLSQAATPLVFSGNKILSDLPDKIDVSPKAILNSLNHYNHIAVSSFIDNYLDGDHVDCDIKDMLYECYNFVGEGDMLVDPVNNIFPTIHVTKIKQSFSEKEIMRMVGRKLNYWCSCDDVGRINEILELIEYKPKDGAKSLHSSRSIKKKLHGVLETLRDTLASNKWQIRDVDLMLSFVNWVYRYIQNGNLAALTNITKLKIMTHKKQPIYSIKEVV